MTSAFTEIEEILRRFDLEAENRQLKEQLAYLKRSRQATRGANKSLQKRLKELKNS